MLGAVAIVLAIVAIAISFAVPGPAGSSYSVSTTLKSGQSETGIYSAAGGPSGAYFEEGVNFRVPLAADLPRTAVNFIPDSSSYTANCTGPGEALPGNLCVYQTLNSSSSFGGIINQVSQNFGASMYGFEVYFTANSNTNSWSYGTWTVTAP